MRTLDESTSEFGVFLRAGIEHLNRVQVRPEVAGLSTRTIAIRDQRLPASGGSGDAAQPGFDVSVNFVPVTYPGYCMAKLQIAAGATELWRVISAVADTILEVQVRWI